MFIFLSWSWRGGVSTVQQKEFGEKNGSNYFSCFPLKYNNKQISGLLIAFCVVVLTV